LLKAGGSWRLRVPLRSYAARACGADRNIRRTDLGAKEINVNKHIISKNTKTGSREPPIAVRGKSRNQKATYGHEVELVYNGEVVGKFVYSPDKPISCGARLYFVTDKLEVVPKV